MTFLEYSTPSPVKSSFTPLPFLCLNLSIMLRDELTWKNSCLKHSQFS
jgi:hypothetical protein